MEAAATYPRWPPVLVSTGLGGSVAAMAPDRIPLQPTLVNDPRERTRVGGVDCHGILRRCHRNLPGYSYLRPHKRTQFRSHYKALNVAKEEFSYVVHAQRDFLPRDFTVSVIQRDVDREHNTFDVPKWQGNTLAGLPLQQFTPGDQAVFFPTGQVLQQACVYYNASDRKRRRISNTVECGTVVRQFELMGGRASYEMYGTDTVRVAARGAANCTLLTASFDGVGDDAAPQLDVAHRLQFDQMLYHIAASPHTDSDLAFVTGDGKLHTWNPVGGLETVQTKEASVDERLVRCEFSSNPCVLWTSNRVRVRSVDVRDPLSLAPTTLFDLVVMHAPLSEIYGIKRRDSAPFQVVVGTSVSIELLDTRMPGRALLSWAQREEMQAKKPYFGALDEIHWSGPARPDKGLILSSTQARKLVSIYPFARHEDITPAGAEAPALAVAPLRSTSEARTVTSQYVAADAPLDLQLRDGSEWTSLLGMCAVVDNDNATSATVFQLNSMGDLFCQQIRSSNVVERYDTAVQLELPCGITTHFDPNDSDNARLPLPSDAILSEHDTQALTPFYAAPLKDFVEGFPRLPPTDSMRMDDVFKLQTSQDAIKQLRRLCRPSVTLYRMHRFVNDELKLHVSAQGLLQVVRSHAEFHVRSIHHGFGQRRTTVLDPITTIHGDTVATARAQADPRLATCRCCPQTATEPCEAVACIVPHALAISSASDLHTEVCLPTNKFESGISDDYAAILEQAQELYGQKSFA